MSLKTGILFWDIHFKFNLKLKLQMFLNVGKQEIIFRFPVYKESKNNFQKIILTFQHYQTLSQRIFFEWIPGLEVSGEKKMGCVHCPYWKTCCDFYASTKKETLIKVISGLQGIILWLPERLKTRIILSKGTLSFFYRS